MASYHKTFDYVNVNCTYTVSPRFESRPGTGATAMRITDRPHAYNSALPVKSHTKKKKIQKLHKGKWRVNKEEWCLSLQKVGLGPSLPPPAT
jgi:hypothetical protein